MSLLTLMAMPARAQTIFLETFDNVGGPTGGTAGTYTFPAGWTLANVDNRIPAAQVSYVNDAWERREDFKSNVADSAAFSTSWYNPEGAADDWMWTPAITLSADESYDLSWDAVTYDPEFRDGYEVRVMTEAPTGSTGNIGNMVSASTLVFSTPAENSDWTTRKVDLTAYVGKTIYIGFRNNSNSQFLLLIDDVRVARRIDYLGEVSGVDTPEYTQYPIHQLSPLAISGGTVTNIGNFALTDVRLNVSVQNSRGIEVFATPATETVTLDPEEDAVFSFAAGWEPTEAGVYTLNYYPSYAETDNIAMPDTIVRMVTVTDSVYARDNGDIIGDFGIGSGNGGYLGQAFKLNVQTELHGVTVGYNAHTDGETSVGQRYAAVIWDTDGTGKPNAIVAATDTLTYRNDGALITTLPIYGGKKLLPAGMYVVTAVEFPGENMLRLAQTAERFTPGTVWMGPTNPNPDWSTIESSGSSFSKTLYLRLLLAEDLTPPAVIGVAVPDDGYYVEDDVLEFTVGMSEDVVIDGTDGVPYLAVTIGTETVRAVYAGPGAGADELVFRYTVQAGDRDIDGITVGTLNLNGGTIADVVGNTAVLTLINVGSTSDVFVYAVTPSVTLSTTAAAVVNAPFTATVAFSEAVSGFVLGDVDATNAGLSDLQTADHITYTLQVSPVTDGTVTVNVPADVAVNIGSNGNTASNTLEVIYDATAPSVPAGLSADAGDTAIELAWTANTEEDLAYYRIYAGTTSAPSTLLETVAGGITAYTHTGLTNGTEYYYQVSAVDAAGNESERSAEVSAVPMTAQTITFGALDVMTYGDDPLTLAATASSGLAVSYTSSDESVASVSGNVLTVHAAGRVTLTAIQEGDAAFYAAVPVERELTVDPAVLTITVNAGQGKVYGSDDPELIYTAGDFALSDDETVLIGALGREPGEDVADYTITKGDLSAGNNYTIDFTGADFAITPLAVTVTADGQTKVFGEADPELTYTVSPALVDGDRFTGALAREPGGEAGRYAITQGTLALDDNYRLSFHGAELEILPAEALDITLPGGSFVYDGTVKSLSITGRLPEGLTVRYEISGKRGNGATDAGTYEVTAMINGGDNYGDLELTATLEITPAERTLTFPALPVMVYGAADFNGGAVSSSGEAVTYTSSNTAVATVSAGGLIRVMGAGETIITATVPENGNYTDRPSVSRALVVGKAGQTIAFNAPAEVNRNAGSIGLDVLASSELPVELTVDDSQVATLEGLALHIHRLGTVNITATQAGDDNHEAAEPVTVTIRVVDPSSDFAVQVHPAVSPNGDGINEFLMIEGIRDYPENQVSIFNRNGTIVWEASGYDNANTAFRGMGTGGIKLPAGTYFYVVELRVNGTLDYRKGYFVMRY